MKYVLVTGAYGGMGRKTAELFKSKGFCVFALDKNVGNQEENIIPLCVDITDEDSVKNAFQKVKSVTDELYAIVHFAGVYMLDSLVEMPADCFEKIFKVNLLGAFLVNKTFLPLLKNGSKVIITTSELAPLDPLPFTGIYAVTKSALDKYAYSLRMELQLLGIKVSVIRAGAVCTGMLGVSTDSLGRFCQNTKLYSCNAKRFKSKVDWVEARSIPPEKIALNAYNISQKNNPKFAYSINRNPLLLLLNALPKRLQLWIIRRVLK